MNTQNSTTIVQAGQRLCDAGLLVIGAGSGIGQTTGMNLTMVTVGLGLTLVGTALQVLVGILQKNGIPVSAVDPDDQG